MGMKILWLSGRLLSSGDDGYTGTWLSPVAESLVNSGEVQLGNITQGRTAHVVRCDRGAIRQWIVPCAAGGRPNGLPGTDLVDQIVRVVEEFRPQVVHVWGTESFWGVLTARRAIHGPAVVLEMQGLKLAVAKLFHGGLSLAERMACMGLKEYLCRTGIRQKQKAFQRWGDIEREIIAGHENICVQSPWMEAQVRAINPSAKIFPVDLPLRSPFYREERWKGEASRHRIFCSAAYSAPYKGLHLAIRAAAIVRRVCPDIQLCIAGQHQRAGLRRDGYVAWLNREISRLKLENQVVWLGPLSAAQIISELERSSVALFTSYVESYCLALCEAMALGVPTVTSYSGGPAHIAKDEESSLFFPSGDAEMCAYQLGRLLEDRELAGRLSHNARRAVLSRNDPDRLLQRRIAIYRTLADEPT